MPTPPLPTASTGPSELWQLPAAALAEAIRTRTASAVEVTRSFLDRIEQTNPVLNALVDVHADEALADARRADAAVADGSPLGPLHGVPVSTKINTDQRGRITSHGIAALAHAPAEADAACVTALREAGAILLGRSNAPAFSYRWFSDNDLHGRTLNPWDDKRTPGGSSGGAASSLAVGMTALAQGNDIGGSIRYPAACCGVVGIRPTVGRVSDWAPPAMVPGPDGTLEQLDFPLTVQGWAVEGPLGRDVADTRLALHAMSRADLRVPFGVPALPDRPAPSGPVTVKVVRGIGTVASHPAVERAVELAAAHLADAGYRVEEDDDPAAADVLAEAARIWQLLIFEDFRPTLPLARQVGDEAFKTSLEYSFAAAARVWGETPSLQAYIHGWARRGTLITRLQELLGSDTVLLTPVSAELPFEHDADAASLERGAELIAAQWPMAAVPALGFPAVTVPALLADGLPVSVQLIGGRFEEELILDAAQAVEDRTPLFAPPFPAR
ncbi:amidase [Yinghuangia soli]|uniref:Amidase n=1 Tax=Yinghuangia soli TaxID=2908204 RepID=A0AA41Q957_9ACTN|nr:amidase [Yinghuangia soli]MCF2533210.1 amidase [Yinghuangia soli]